MVPRRHAAVHVALTSRFRDEDERECLSDALQLLTGLSFSEFTEVLFSPRADDVDDG